MTLKRIGTLAAVLLTLGACSHMPMGPTAYSALPSPSTGPQPSALQGAGPGVPLAEGDVVLAPVDVPGAPKVQEVDVRQGGLNPSAVLDASTRTRMSWKTLHPQDLQERSILASRSARSNGIDGLTMSAASSAGTPVADRPPAKASAKAPANYDREAAMSALLKGGQDAARPICSGC